LESEISTLKSSTTSNENEFNSLKSRISTLESEKRESLALLESKSAAHDKLAEELSAQHKKTIELRRELSTVEQNLQAANSAAASARFREQNLQQEVDLTKKNNEWFETELKTKGAEYTKFRKEKSARIAELQRTNEEAANTIDTLRRSENTLKARLDETEQRYEESLATISQLKDSAIQTEETFRVELETASRLAKLQESAAQSAKQRAQECQIALENAKNEAAEEISRLRVEMETEHADKEAAETRVSELEATVAQLELQGPRNRSASPARSLNGAGPTTPMRPGTPGGTFSPRMSRTKGNLTFTQMYTEYDKMRTQLSAEQKTNQELRSTLDEMLQELESTKPEIDDLRSDHKRLEDAVMDLSGLLESSAKERDDAIKASRKWQGKVEGLTREGDILRQQLRDLSAEVKVLVMEVAIAKNGEDYDREELEKIARKEIEDSAAELNPTGLFISRNLVTFKDLHEIQEQNLTLRRMLRELGDKMEGEEARAKDAIRQQEVEELKELRIRVQTYRDEIANLVAQSKSYVKERDTFRSLLTHRRQTVGGDAAFSQSVPPGSAPPGAFESQLKDNTDYGDLLRKLQAHYDTFREETLADHSSLRQQVNELSRKNSELMSEISRSNSQLAAATQRAELLQSNFDMLKNENGGLQNRYSSLLENSSKQELRTQQAAEDLVEAKGLVESLQRENSNLKAEKDLWKNIEKRLIDDIESLRNERGRLDSLNANLQTILNERDHTESDSRRRLQSTVETLESELQSTKRKLNDETESAKQAALRRNYEQEQSQKRINDLVTSLGAVREELVATKTTRDHLQSRVDELTVELKSAEERLQVIQSRPNVSAIPIDRSAVTEESRDANGLSHEQELLIEISELKRDLELAKGELAHAKEQVEEYRAISQSTEERMEAEADTHAQYREETDRLIEEKDKKIQDLESRIEEISTELSTTTSEITKLRDEQGEATRHLEEQKAHLESELSRLKDDNDRHVAAAQCHQDDLKAQAEISQNLQRNYEAELIKHAEAAKNVQTVRAEANQLKLDVAELRTQTETYKKDLAQKEESWAEQRARYEGELAEVQKRREEVNHQNSVLHSQLENITAQIAALQRDRAGVPESDEQEGDQAAPDLEGLQEVIKYLRREKEIVEVQYHLSTQEAKRLRQQFDYTQSQLDETRLKLEQQRRAAADNEHHALNHNKLMETLNELNLFRESSVTLRNQVKDTEAALAEKSARVDELTQQIQPLETKIRELEGIVEAKDGELQLLQADRDHYQKRVQNILQKYDRVDPQEMEALNEKLATLQKERDEAISARDTLQAEAAETIQAAEQAAETRITELRQKLTEQFKARSRELSTKINAHKQEKDVLQAELDRTKAELEAVKAKVPETPPTSTTTSAAPATDEAAPVNATPASQFPTGTTTLVSSGDEQKVKELEAKIERLQAALAEKDALIATKDAEMDARVKERADKLKDSFNSKLAEIKASHRQELEKLSSGEAPVPATPVAGAEQTPATPSKSLPGLPDLNEQQARDLVQKHETIRTIVRNNIRTKVAQAEEKAKEEVQKASKAHEEAVAALKKAQEEETTEKVKAAVQLSDKKTAARISMLDTRLKTSQAKIDVVSKAAEETPQRPVVEVWEIAKTARPPAPTPKPPAGTSPVPVASPAQASPVTPAASAPGPAPAAQQAAVPVPVPEASVPRQSEPGAVNAEAAPSTPNPFGQVQPSSQQQPQPQPQQQPQSQSQSQSQSQPPSLPSKPPSGTAPGMLRALQSGLPVARGGRGGRGGGQQNPFGHPQPQQADQQAQGQTQSQRGTGLSRGRGGRGGQGRGGNQAAGGAQTQNQNQGPASPAANRGALNVQARQFIPQGNKRSREDGSDTTNEGASGGKRMRGGGGQARGGGSS
jgi:nucleoprotein TPR